MLPNEIYKKDSNVDFEMHCEGLSNCFPLGIISYVGEIVVFDVFGTITIDGVKRETYYDFKIGLPISEKIIEEHFEQFTDSTELEFNSFTKTYNGIIAHAKISMKA